MNNTISNNIGINITKYPSAEQTVAKQSGSDKTTINSVTISQEALDLASNAKLASNTSNNWNGTSSDGVLAYASVDSLVDDWITVLGGGGGMTPPI